MAIKQEVNVVEVNSFAHSTTYWGDGSVEVDEPEVTINVTVTNGVGLSLDSARALVVELQEAIEKAQGEPAIYDFRYDTVPTGDVEDDKDKE